MPRRLRFSSGGQVPLTILKRQLPQDCSAFEPVQGAAEMRLRPRSARTGGPILLSIALLLVLIVLPANTPRAGEVLQRVIDDGIMRCGVTRSGPGLSEIGADGHWNGLFVDFCRVVAAAVLNDPDAIEFVEVNDIIRFDALNEDGFDVLMANTTWTITRNSALGIAFTGTIYYDGQSFLAHKSLGAMSLAEIEKARVCVSGGTTTVKNVEEMAAVKYPGLEILAFQSIDGTYEAFFARECEIITYDRLALIAQLRNRTANPENFVLFPEIVSKEPLGPAVRKGDQAWFDVVRWAVLATFAAEEMGVTSRNIDDVLASTDRPEIRRLFGLEGKIGEGLGMPGDWAANIVRQVGNYGEIFDRNVGAGSPLKLDRGLNALWTDGGLHYAPPIR
ncbi:MAG: amino acid ABC transporter substrate-binding protein [Minwuia sp.]|uniref:amino acid ABC transporter substrate-binding protein n=1 Tax=Minwuia sp. TaxID=2493630 RepID=UPI003A89A7E8